MNYEEFRPPLNPTPRRIWLERRRAEIVTYIDRSTTASYPIQQEWVNEYNRILAELNAMKQ